MGAAIVFGVMAGAGIGQLLPGGARPATWFDVALDLGFAVLCAIRSYDLRHGRFTSQVNPSEEKKA
jgi:TRAP-type C4-dicarboxylate transport system permease large subunit